jgi:hypothetical protein
LYLEADIQLSAFLETNPNKGTLGTNLGTVFPLRPLASAWFFGLTEALAKPNHKSRNKPSSKPAPATVFATLALIQQSLGNGTLIGGKTD